MTLERVTAESMRKMQYLRAPRYLSFSLREPDLKITKTTTGPKTLRGLSRATSATGYTFLTGV